MHEWEMFRRHLVTLHYDELAQWLIDTGIPGDRIWSSQGLMAPSEGCMPLALAESSPVRNYDSGGVSIEGSKPRNAHLGGIVYGPAATNDMPMENGRSLYATLADIDPGFGVVEFNTADLREPGTDPDYALAYRALRDLWNAGARFVSPMAWNGSSGLAKGTPGYAAHTAWRNTPLEEATLDFLLARAGLPRGSQLWTFGTQHHADDDGWTARLGSFVTAPGRIVLAPDAQGRVALESPAELRIDPRRIATIVAGLPDDRDPEEIRVLLRSGAVIELTGVPVGLRWPLAAIWLFAVCNAFNLLDVMDGLAAGVGAVAALAFGVVALTTGEYPEAAASLALAGALGGFLVFNAPPARIYLGDAGSLAVGLTLGALAIAIRWSDRSAAGFLAPLAILAVPLADTAYVSVLRARAGKPFWHGSPDHFPLRLRVRLGGSTAKAMVAVVALSVLGAVAGVGTAVLWAWEVGIAALGGYALAVIVLLAVLARVRMEASE